MISDKNLEETIKKFASVEPEYIYLDKLNIKRRAHWDKIKKVLEKHYPQFIEEWERILFTKNDYYDDIKKRVVKLCKKYNLKYELCY